MPRPAKRRTDAAVRQRRQVKRAAKTERLLLPGNITPITEAYIFARAAGYLQAALRGYRRPGARGQLLAEIDAPDLDQQVSQAQAAWLRRKASSARRRRRWSNSSPPAISPPSRGSDTRCSTATGAVSRQDGDMQSTAAKTAEANVTAGRESRCARRRNSFAPARPSLQRLITLQGYEKITAPFAGIITARNVDVGALISATGSSQGPARPIAAAPSDVPSGGEIFRVAEIGRLRVLVRCRKCIAEYPGGPGGKGHVQERPNLTFPGKVTRTSSSLDAASRTLLTEVQVDNPTGVLLPGMYALCSSSQQRADPPFLVPDASLVVRANGTMLAVLEPLTGQSGQKADGRDRPRNWPVSGESISWRCSRAGTMARSSRFWTVCRAARKWWSIPATPCRRAPSCRSGADRAKRANAKPGNK